MSKNLIELAALGIQAQFTTTKAPTVLLVGQAGAGKNKGCRMGKNSLRYGPKELHRFHR